MLARIDAINEGAHLIADEVRRAAAIKYAELARAGLANGEFERAWRNILDGERLMLEEQSDAQLVAKARALDAEVGVALPENEAKPITDLVTWATTDQSRPQEWRAAIVEAQLLFERRVIYLYDTRERIANRLSALVAALAVFLIAFVWLLWCAPSVLTTLYDLPETLDGPKVPMTPQLLLGTFLLGGLGASLSAILSFTSLGRLPGDYESWMVTLARPLVGAASGLVAVMFVHAGLVEFQTTAAIGLVAFLFGFSERLIIGAAQKLETAQKT